MRRRALAGAGIRRDRDGNAVDLPVRREPALAPSWRSCFATRRPLVVEAKWPMCCAASSGCDGLRSTLGRSVDPRYTPQISDSKDNIGGYWRIDPVA